MAITTDRSSILGWGADLDRADRPAVPMERMPPRLEGARLAEPTQQTLTVEVLHSVEKPGITPVFGTSNPPRGLSGWMRRRAFRRSESDIRHWMMLLAADRVDVVEGLFGDARKSPGVRSAAIVGAGLLIGAWWLRRR